MPQEVESRRDEGRLAGTMSPPDLIGFPEDSKPMDLSRTVRDGQALKTKGKIFWLGASANKSENRSFRLKAVPAI